MILICQKLGSFVPVQQKIKLPSPNENIIKLENIKKYEHQIP